MKLNIENDNRNDTWKGKHIFVEVISFWNVLLEFFAWHRVLLETQSQSSNIDSKSNKKTLDCKA